MGDTFRRCWCAPALALAFALACHSGAPRQARRDGPSCRDIARRAELVIGRASDAVRDEATRFYAEMLDLCQEPGLAQRARACLTRAADVDSARRCPSLPATGDTSRRDDETDAPTSCDTVVKQAMKIVVRESEAMVSPTDYAEEEQLFLRDCAAATPTGRRCAAKARTIDAIDACLALPDAGGGDDLGD